VLWIVWDTVRADHLGLYGYEHDTTPHLVKWARDARVFENARSTAAYTLPSHASMFTGLLPSEHCTHNGHQILDEAYPTLAELLSGSGYETYLYSANPHVSELGNFDQGFDVVEHPWSERFETRAIEIVEAKLVDDRTTELGDRLKAVAEGRRKLTPWNIKTAGELAEEATVSWLEQRESGRPFFVFLNYMEAHRPHIPARPYREKFMTPEDVEQSYLVDRSWRRMWQYVFGLADYSEQEIALTRSTYDATIRELDDLFASLLDALDAGGFLENTVIVLTSDHGEHLGEHHLMDHQYSLYEEVLRIPLVIKYPPKVQAGRDPRPVMNFDLFPTLLELTRTQPPVGHRSSAISLLAPSERRLRLSEEPASNFIGMRTVRETHPEVDLGPWSRSMRALHDGRYKLIWSSDDRHEVYDLELDSDEARNLHVPGRFVDLEARLQEMRTGLNPCLEVGSEPRQLTVEERARLQVLGYADEAQDTLRERQ